MKNMIEDIFEFFYQQLKHAHSLYQSKINTINSKITKV